MSCFDGFTAVHTHLPYRHRDLFSRGADRRVPSSTEPFHRTLARINGLKHDGRSRVQPVRTRHVARTTTVFTRRRRVFRVETSHTATGSRLAGCHRIPPSRRSRTALTFALARLNARPLGQMQKASTPHSTPAGVYMRPRVSITPLLPHSPQCPGSCAGPLNSNHRSDAVAMPSL